MDELGMGLIWMVVDFISALSFFVSMAELALKRKNKNQGFFSSCRCELVGGCFGFGLVVGG